MCSAGPASLAGYTAAATPVRDSSAVRTARGGALTVTVGHGARRRTCSVTLPISSRPSPVRPCVPMTITSQFVSAATRKISAAASPETRWCSTSASVCVWFTCTRHRGGRGTGPGSSPCERHEPIPFDNARPLTIFIRSSSLRQMFGLKPLYPPAKGLPLCCLAA